MTRIGDIFEIPLSKGRRAYGQYIFKDKKGPLIKVFDIISEQEITIDRLKNAGVLFPPVITGLYAALKKGFWKKIGNYPIKDFIYPNFIGTNYDYRIGKATIWFLWDGTKYIKIGATLPEEYKKLEYLVVWDPHDIVRRIETGEIPYPYRDLILYNQFKPKINVKPIPKEEKNKFSIE